MAEKTQNAITIKDFIEYVNTNTSEIITKSVFAPMSTTLFRVQTGVTAETALNLLDTAVTFGDGSVCGFDDNVQQTISQRTIVPGYIKVNAEWCDKIFLDSFANHMVNMAAGRETMPFEEALVADVVRNIGKELEFAIWQGEKEDNPNKNNLGWFDGLIKIIKEADCKNVGASQATMIERVWDVYNAIPDEVLFDEVIYMSNSNFRKLVKELVDANMYHYERNIDESMDIILPGTNTHVKAVNGLSKYDETDPDFIVAMNPNHTVYGVDMQNDNEVVKVWFSDDNDTLRLKIAFAAGVQIALPNEVVCSYAESGSGSGNGN